MISGRLLGSALSLSFLAVFTLTSRVWSVETSNQSPAKEQWKAVPATDDVPIRLERLANGLTQPIYATAPAGSTDLFVVERVGRIVRIEAGDVANDPFLDLTDDVDTSGERGLLGLAFPRDYAQSRAFYICYTDRRSLDTVIARYRASTDGVKADRTSRQQILRIHQPAERIDHKAGWIGFRPGEPNYLYISTGDGGGANDVDNNAQNRQSLLGKILRIDVSKKNSGYRIPKDNPFVKEDDARPEIWAYGLRNPFRMSFDRLTGDLFIGDVGQNTREEINYEPAGSRGGRNYGWRILEGSDYNGAIEGQTIDATISPVIDYSHASQTLLGGCVIGGYVYRGPRFPELQGTYFFADFTNARIYSFRYEKNVVEHLTDWTALLNPANNPFSYSGLVSFGEDGEGELCMVDFAGSVYRFTRSETGF